MDATEDDLLARARKGDRAALGQMLERHQRQIWRFGMKLCRDEADAQDVTQETLLAAARNLSDFRGESSLSTWLFTLARSFCVKQRRKSVHAPAALESLEGDEVMQQPAPGPTPEEATGSAQLQRALEEAIAALTPTYREVFVLRDVEGLSAAETAKVLELSVEAVKSRLHRARAAVRDRFTQSMQLPERAPGPNCPDIVALYSQHVEGEIGKDLCLKMEQHLDSCPHCTEACDRLKQVLATCSASPLPEVPARVQDAVRKALGAVGESSFLT